MKRLPTLALFATTAIFASPSVAQANTVQYVETNHGWVGYHTAPKLSSPVVGRLQLNDKALLMSQANPWWYEIQVNGEDVYITTNSQFVHVASDSTPPSAPAPTSAWQTQADALITTAKTQLGAPYYWGHQVPIGSVAAGQPYGFDCSNFVAWSYKTALGIHFSGASRYQRYNVGTPVPLGQIREGDLLFFAIANSPSGAGHVGLYMGNGMVIQEGGGWGKVAIEPLSGTWLGRNLVFARRVIN